MLYNFFKKIPKWLLILVGTFFVLLSIVLIAFVSFDAFYSNKIYPGVVLGGKAIGGQEISQASKMWREQVDKINLGFDIKFKEKSIKLTPSTVFPEADSSEVVYEVNANKSFNKALDWGRNGTFKQKWHDRLTGLFKQIEILPEINIDNEILKKLLIANFSDLIYSAIDAQVTVNKTDLIISESKDGSGFDVQQALFLISKKILNGDVGSLNLVESIIKPEISTQAINDNYQVILKQINNWNQTDSFYLTAEQNKWLVNKIVLNKWLVVSKQNGDYIVDLDDQKIKQYLELEIESKINIEPRQNKIIIKDGKAEVFQSGQDGKKLNVEKTIILIKEAVSQNNKTVELPIDVWLNEAVVTSADDYGLKEIIGTGKSNYNGSPKNRRQNIKVGSNSINGLLIKPDEEFSLMSALGAIDGEHGYVQELVIKDNKTMPEYGGGLCQIGTTLFRAIIDSGLPVTMRRNHSYRVGYYEPAGTDATIYDPYPDFRFKNDTSNYILIETIVNPSELVFNIWGTKDGRIIESNVLKPVIYNIVKPGPTKLIETDSLKPGVKKCTEKAHNGADAYFDYKVIYIDDRVQETRFKSHYVPWQEVCLIGKTPIVEEVKMPETNVTKTDNILIEPVIPTSSILP